MKTKGVHLILFLLHLFSSKLTIQIKNTIPNVTDTNKKSNPKGLLFYNFAYGSILSE
ncbi:hypothetical protein SAMN03080602_00122 [Arenibacter troitsensis]|uniref:Uncharacterized protein n=1 Tax=Arenibacter troitsensis TaxID=188872 RepID=A0A1X7HXA2_9FLAO|nr:hypothetical protein SAMN03080602_00122 [Arenibacter troitsensis]